jgi:hypothetical protein
MVRAPSSSAFYSGDFSAIFIEDIWASSSAMTSWSYIEVGLVLLSFTYWSEVEVCTVFGISLNVILEYGFVQCSLVLSLAIALTLCFLFLSCFLVLPNVVFAKLIHLQLVKLPNALILPPLDFGVGFSDENDVRHVVLAFLMLVIIVIKCS